jgi:hypothetical protein
LEKSRHLLEDRGVRIAAVSYDPQEILQTFAKKHDIRFPLLSDKDSAVIRRFGIFNANMASGLRAYGVPHPVEYLVSPDGTVIRKYFVPNYQHRVTASEVALREFGRTETGASSVTLSRGALAVRIGLSSATAFAGQRIGFFTQFQLEPGWHVYGAPLPESYIPTSVTFEDPKILTQSFELPRAQPKEIAALNEVLPIYTGAFEGMGSLLLKFPLDGGPAALSGKVHFQQCSEAVCEAPESIAFELKLMLEQFFVAGT